MTKMIKRLIQYRFPFRGPDQPFWIIGYTAALCICTVLAALLPNGVPQLPPRFWLTAQTAAMLATCLSLSLLLTLILTQRARSMRLLMLSLPLSIAAGSWSSLLLQTGSVPTAPLFILPLFLSIGCSVFLSPLRKCARLAARRPGRCLALTFIGGLALPFLPIAGPTLPPLVYATIGSALLAHFFWASGNARSRRWLPLQLIPLTLLVDSGISLFYLQSQLPLSPPAIIVKSLTSGIVLLPYVWRESVAIPRLAAAQRLRRRSARLVQTQSAAAAARAARQELWQTFMNLSSASAEPISLTQRLQTIVDQGAKVLNAESCLIRLVQGHPATLWTVAVHGTVNPPPIPLDQFALRVRYGTDQTVVINDLQESSVKPFPDWSRSALHSMVGVPIFYGTRWLGALEAYAQPRAAFSSDAASLLILHAKLAAAAIAQDEILEESLRKDAALRLINDIMELSSFQPSPSLLLTKSASALAQFLHTDAAAAYIIQRQGQKIQLWDALLEKVSADDSRRLKTLFNNGLPPWITSSSTAARALVRLTVAETRTVYALPVYGRQAPLAIIFFLWDYERKQEVPPYLDATFGSISQQIAVNLDRLQLVDSVQKIGLTDSLTSLHNRRFFDFVLTREINRALRHQHPLSLLMFDIDFFKKINDTRGHPAGDAVLREIGQLVQKWFRNTDIQCRYGGEEFAIILPETSIRDAFVLAERFRTSVQAHLFSPDSLRLSLTISVGLAAVDVNSQKRISTASELIFAADQALYTAKQTGRNRTLVWEVS